VPEAIKLSITIVHHHGLEMLRACLSSIYANAPDFPFEVIVVDNVSTDGAVEMMETSFPQVRLIRNTERNGFGFNQNTAISASLAEHIFILNDDTVIGTNALALLSTYLDAHPTVGLVGPRLLNGDGSLQLSCYKFPSPIRCIWENSLLTAAFPDSTVFGDYRKWKHDQERSVDFVIGAAMLVRRAVIEAVGTFDTLFFMYSEETDWQMRVRAAGWDIRLCPQAQITHFGGQSTEGIKDKQFAQCQMSSVRLITKHYGVSGAVVQRASMISGSLLRLALWSAIPLLAPSKRAVSLEQISRWKRLLTWWSGFGPHEGLAPGEVKLSAK
jgi:hypothetical protein